MRKRNKNVGIPENYGILSYPYVVFGVGNA
jgi:hypothetical protein